MELIVSDADGKKAVKAVRKQMAGLLVENVLRLNAIKLMAKNIL